MEVKLMREVKYWPSIDKWCVCYIAPAHGHTMANAFNQSLKAANAEALSSITRKMELAKEYGTGTETSELTITV